MCWAPKRKFLFFSRPNEISIFLSFFGNNSSFLIELFLSLLFIPNINKYSLFLLSLSFSFLSSLSLLIFTISIFTISMAMENFQLDPDEFERFRIKEMKRLKKQLDMVGFVADAQYGIPQNCPCGGDIIHEVSPIPKYPSDRDTLPGSKYFTCNQFKDDGLHFRQPWVTGVEEEIEKLLRKVEQQGKTIEGMQNQIQSNTDEIAMLKELLGGVRGV